MRSAVAARCCPRLAGAAAPQARPVAVTLGIYLRCPGRAGIAGRTLPDQAVLLDMATTASSSSSLEIWPQEFYFVTGLLVLAALTLFLVTAARAACGAATPARRRCGPISWSLVERFWQGDRNARMRSTRRRGAVKLFKKAHDAPVLARHRRWRPAALSYSISATRRRWPPSSCRHGARHRLPLPRHLRADHLCARRHRPRAGLHLHVPLAAHPGRHGRPRDAAGQLQRLSRRAARAPQEGPTAGRGAATASTARPASPSARPASTSATARSSSASSARCASTPATTSWARSAGRAA